uniref:Uncharacterized protein n=1 Tax=Rhizobium leguminosarum TaxID=384 RepID=A0A154IEC4_RHILE|nr:hypothetical protein A4A59_25345 [Rhizobium leguminosarum]
MLPKPGRGRTLPNSSAVGDLPLGDNRPNPLPFRFAGPPFELFALARQRRKCLAIALRLCNVTGD